MRDVLILTFEYSDKSGFYICGTTLDYALARAWIAGGENNHVYRVDLNKVMPTHPRSNGYEKWDP